MIQQKFGGTLADHFQKKTWANKLSLRRKLYALKLNEGQPVQSYIKVMTEIFDELAIVGDPLDNENNVVHLLASLPKSFDMLVTALESNPEVPKMEVVMERLLHEESKHKNNDLWDAAGKLNAMTGKHRFDKRGAKCYGCDKTTNKNSTNRKPFKPLLNKKRIWNRRSPP